MKPAKWKNARPRSLENAYEMCLSFALETKRLDVPRVAELMGITSSRLYKWLSKLSMPAKYIPVFEHICGCSFVSQYLASNKGRMVITIPRGRRPTTTEVSDLQRSFAGCVDKLLACYEGKETPEVTSEAIQDSLEKLAWHKGNVDKKISPELTLFADTEVEE